MADQQNGQQKTNEDRLDRRQIYGQLPAMLLFLSDLSPDARLLYAVRSCLYYLKITPAKKLVAFLMGMSPESADSVTRYEAELEAKGFVLPGQSGKATGQLNGPVFITMPDYCNIDAPALIRVAMESYEATGRRRASVHKGAKAKNRKKPFMSPLARLRWLQEYAFTAEEWNEQGQLKIPFQTPKQRRSAPPTVSQPPLPSGDGKGSSQATVPPTVIGREGSSQATVPEISGINDARARREGETLRGGEGAQLPPAPPFASQDQNQPVGWEGWPGDYATATGGKRWIWGREQLGQAAEINALLAASHDGTLNTLELRAAQKKLLADSYWLKRDDTLRGLVTQTQKYLPTRSEVEALCPHDLVDERREAGEQHGKAGQFEIQTCKGCGRVTKFFIEPVPTLDEEAPFVREWRRTHGGKAPGED